MENTFLYSGTYEKSGYYSKCCRLWRKLLNNINRESSHVKMKYYSQIKISKSHCSSLKMLYRHHQYDTLVTVTVRKSI
jgi:hypothetical protein